MSDQTRELIDRHVSWVRRQYQKLRRSPYHEVTCQCGKTMPVWMMFRCLYCLEYFCAECAEEHFGQTRLERSQLDDDRKALADALYADPALSKSVHPTFRPDLLPQVPDDPNDGDCHDCCGH